MDADPKSPIQEGRSSAFHAASCSSSFWDTAETDEAVANAECEGDLVMSMRSMEKRMNDAIIEATNAVNDIMRIKWERNHCKQALEKIVSNRGFDGRALQRMAEDALDSFPNTPAQDNQNAL